MNSGGFIRDPFRLPVPGYGGGPPVGRRSFGSVGMMCSGKPKAEWHHVLDLRHPEGPPSSSSRKTAFSWHGAREPVSWAAACGKGAAIPSGWLVLSVVPRYCLRDVGGPVNECGS